MHLQTEQRAQLEAWRRARNDDDVATSLAALRDAAQLGNAIGLPLLLFGAILHNPLLAILGAVFYLGVVVFQLITLPVELDASKRALENLDEMRLLQTEEEAHGAAAVLNAAALTYVAAALAGIATLLYYLLMIFGGRRS